jgi:CubicO group peptidase (beta-lactamase class C family)
MKTEGIVVATDWTAFEEYVLRVMEENYIVGAAVAVAGPKDVLYAKGFGVKNLETKEPVTPNTIFGCASVSKSFTSMAIAQLADRGLISVDDPVVDHIPGFRLAGAKDMWEVKMRHILSHTTGLPPMRRREEITDFQSHIEYLAGAEYELLGEPGEYFSYCNDTFLLNGHIIESKTGQLYRRYMTQHILDAAGMHRSTYNLEELPKIGDLSTPYIYNPKTRKHEEQPWPALGTYEVGGGVRSCVLDLMKYGQIYLGGGVAANGVRIVSDDGQRRMWTTPMYRTTRVSDYNLALVTTKNYANTGATLVEHSGGQPGVSSNFGFVPEKGITVAALTNVTSVPAAAIWLAAVNAALGLPLDTMKSVETERVHDTAALSRFEGNYRSDEGGNITLALKDGSLVVTLEGMEFPAKASDERTVFFQAQGQQQVLRFYFDERKCKDHPWAVLAHSRMLRRK